MGAAPDGRVLVTGGACGIGTAVAARCREEGWQPVTVDLRDADVVADLSDPDQTARALREVLADGPVHRLVNNVGAAEVQPLEEVDTASMQRLWQLNVHTTVQCTQALLPDMRRDGFGRVVNIASRAALGKEGRTGYAASKAAVLGLTRTWALELAAHGVTVNAVGPGPIRTALFDQANPAGDPRTQQIVRSIPVQRMGEPADVAHTVAHFLDERAGFVTGQVVYVCGGKTVGLAPV